MKFELEEMNFGYSRNNLVLQDIRLTLEKTGLICIIGPNGVGKSTLVKCMNKLHTPTKGKVILEGKDLKEYTLKELAHHIGFVPASSNDMFSLTVLDTVAMGRHPTSRFGSEKEDLHVAFEVLDSLKISHLAMRNYNELSAGQHQKVSIARGLAQDPDVLILDEPTANLDIRHQVQVIELLHRISHEKSMTVLMISHDLNVAAKYADWVIVMSTPGVIYDIGTPKDVITEDMIRFVYGMDCEVLDRGGKPHVILGEPISDEEMVELHSSESSMIGKEFKC